MEADIESLEEGLKTLLSQLQIECAIFERIVYKNKNQHRRCSYFQYLLKVRRDLRLLQSADLEGVFTSCFEVITGRRPKHMVHLLESLKWRKTDGGQPNFMERLLGAARLLSQMVEPMLKAASEVATLLARSHFMGFSVLVLALLARLRVLVQQILLDAVSIFNRVSSTCQKKQSMKITQGGIEVYREFYPEIEGFVTLECEWRIDKFVLLERTNKCEIRDPEGDGQDASVRDSSVQYNSLESFLGDGEDSNNKADVAVTAKEVSSCSKENKVDSSVGFSLDADKQTHVEVFSRGEDGLSITGTPGKNLPIVEPSRLDASSGGAKIQSCTRKVAFVSVKRSLPRSKDVTDPPLKKTANSSCGEGDRFYNLLTGGNLKGSLF